MDKKTIDNPKNNGLYQPGWDYLTDIYYSDREKTSIWSFINFVRRNKGIYGFAKTFKAFFRHGPKEILWLFTSSKRGHRGLLKKALTLSKSEKATQKKAVFPNKIKISIISVLNNTNEQYLKEMIDSVLEQTYADWELCLADGSGKDHSFVRQICLNYTQNDKRIKYSRIRNSEPPAVANRALKMATGDYIGILDHNDILHPASLYETVQAVLKTNADFIYTDEAVFTNGRINLKIFKPDYAVDSLYSNNYINHFTVFSRKLYNKAGKFNVEFNGSYNYDFILRYTRLASKVYHIPKLLYFNRSYRKPVTESNGKINSAFSGINAVTENLKSRGLEAKVENKFGFPGFYRIAYKLQEEPLVSIIIPNKDHISLLRDCLSSIMEKTTYENYEIIIVENNSENNETFTFYDELKKYKNISVVYWQRKGFNFSDICNYGAECAKGSQLVFLNNDIMIITPDWIEEMLMYSQRKDVGVVGAKLYFLNGAVQHAGIVLGLGGLAGHIYLGASYREIGYMARLHIVQNMSAVTGACMMVKKTVFEEAGGFTSELFDSYNDVDLCLKIKEKGYLVVWTPYAEAYHLESKSRGYISFSKRKGDLSKESTYFYNKWGSLLKSGDPYYNPHFSLERADYSLK